jgi:hypothetical protein
LLGKLFNPTLLKHIKYRAMYNTFLKLLTLNTFLQNVADHRAKLLIELKDYGCDPVRRMRRIRMLTHLAQYEADTIKKIDSFETDDPKEWLDFSALIETIDHITNRSA